MVFSSYDPPRFLRPGDSIAKLKFPGETALSREYPVDVGWRGFREEVTRPHSKVGLDLRYAKLVYQRFTPDDDHLGGIHARLFFVFSVDLIAGDNDRWLRTTPRREDDGTVLGPPHLERVEVVREGIFPTHKSPLAFAIEFLARDRKITDCIYGETLELACEHVRLTNENESGYRRSKGIPLGLLLDEERLHPPDRAVVLS